MNFFSVLAIFGGLSFFLYGMHVMSSGLKKLAGSKLEGTLKVMTSNPFKGLLLGIVITMAIQSSSAMTVMLVGFVNSGLMTLGQTIGVIMGSNIGTTVTAWLLSLSGIESDNIVIGLLKPDNFSPILAFIGVLMIMLSKKGRQRDIGSIFIGFAVLMYGMQIMGNAVKPLTEIEGFTNLLLLFSNPFIGIVVGALFTAVIQSSAASIGVLQAFALTGSLSFGAALPIILGQNIGTCVTSVLSSIGANINAKRVTIVHIYFNLIGTAIFLIVFYTLDAFLHFAFVNQPVQVYHIALIHSIFNISSTAILFPFIRLLEKAACLTIRDKNTQESYVLLDERLMLSPAFAIAECSNQTVKMIRLARRALLDSIRLLENYDEKLAEEVEKNESIIDTYEDKLGTFLVQLSSKELAHSDSSQISQLLHTIGDIERISDHALNLKKAAEEMHDKKLQFSGSANRELSVLLSAVRMIMDMTVESFENGSREAAAKVEPLGEVIDSLKDEIKMRHITRLKNGQCTIELGFILSDILSNLERISSHCSDIALCMIQIKEDALDMHGYKLELQNSAQGGFKENFDHYKNDYSLPPAANSEEAYGEKG